MCFWIIVSIDSLSTRYGMRHYHSSHVYKHDKHVFSGRFCHSSFLRWRWPSTLPHTRLLFGFRSQNGITSSHPWWLYGSETCHLSSIVVKLKLAGWRNPPLFFIQRQQCGHPSCTNFLKVKIFCNDLMNCRDTKVELISNLTHSDSPISIQSLKYSFSYTGIHFWWPSFSLVGKNISPSFNLWCHLYNIVLDTCGPSPTASNSMNFLVSIGVFPACA